MGHPVDNIRSSLSHHLEGRTVVLAVSGSIAAVKAVELARELIRHGARVVPVMSEAATRILHPDALEFATSVKPIVRLTGAVEHVALLGNVPDRADLLLVAPATANTIGKMALGIDDTPVTTCATVAIGNRIPVVVAPAMHDVMLQHPVVQGHVRTLVDQLGVTWVEPVREEHKAKLADVEHIVEAVIHRLANDTKPGPLAGQRALVVSGATEEDVDPVRVLTNRSSGKSGLLIATELHRLGAEVALWQGRANVEVPPHLAPCAVPYRTHADLMDLVKATDLKGFQQVWMPAAIGDFRSPMAAQKVSSDEPWTLHLEPLAKVIEALRRKAPKATLVAFKAESDTKALLARAQERRARYKADFVVANGAASFGSATTEAWLVDEAVTAFEGAKEDVLPRIVVEVAARVNGLAPKSGKAAKKAASSRAKTPTMAKAPSKPRVSKSSANPTKAKQAKAKPTTPRRPSKVQA